MLNRYALLVAPLLAASFFSTSIAEAKLGEDINSYKAKVAKAYTLKSQSNKDGKTSMPLSSTSVPS